MRVGPAVQQARFVDQRLANIEEYRADRHRCFLSYSVFERSG
jgi:hypothetical protein